MENKIYEFETFSFNITNYSKQRKNWVLGGSNKFLNAENYGSDLDVNITTDNVLNYGEFLQDLSSEKIKIHSFKLISNNNLNLKQLLIFQENVMEHQSNLVIPLQKYFDYDAPQCDIVNVDLKLNLDKRHHLYGHIEPKSVLKIVFYKIILEENLPTIDIRKKKNSWFKNFFQKNKI